MNSLDMHYVQILHVGFILLRKALDSGNQEWIRTELEFLHNVPSLIGETSVGRHRYFWEHERRSYLEWVSKPGREFAATNMNTFYYPTLLEMEPLVLALTEGNLKK